jgi:hypothetical protein
MAPPRCSRVYARDIIALVLRHECHSTFLGGRAKRPLIFAAAEAQALLLRVR